MCHNIRNCVVFLYYFRIPLDASSVIRPFAGTDRCGEQMNRPCSWQSLLWVIVSMSCTGPPVHSFTFVSQFFLWSSRCRSSSNVPWKTVFGRVSCRATWPNQTCWRRLSVVRRGSWCPGRVASIFRTKTLALCYPVRDPKQPFCSPMLEVSSTYQLAESTCS